MSKHVVPSFGGSVMAHARLGFIRSVRGRKLRLGVVATLLVVIAALTIALVMQDWRAARREAELRIMSTYSHEIINAEKFMLKKRVKDLQAKLDELGRPPHPWRTSRFPFSVSDPSLYYARAHTEGS